MPMHAPAQEQREFERPTPGAHQGVCVDVVDLGLKRVQYKGQYKLKHKIQFRFQIDERLNEGDYAGQPFIVNMRMTWSLFQSAALKPWLESWLGRKLSEAECDYHHPNYFDFESLLGRNAMLTLAEETKDGRTYTNIISIMPWDTKFGPEIQGESYIRLCKRDGYQGPINDTLEPNRDDNEDNGYGAPTGRPQAPTAPPAYRAPAIEAPTPQKEPDGNYPITQQTRSAIIMAAIELWGEDKAPVELKAYLSPRSLSTLAESAARVTLDQLREKVRQAEEQAKRSAAGRAAFDDDFDDSDPFADA